MISLLFYNDEDGRNNYTNCVVYDCVRCSGQLGDFNTIILIGAYPITIYKGMSPTEVNRQRFFDFFFFLKFFLLLLGMLK